MAEEIHLVDPNGNPWVAGTAEEANDLLCQGYSRADKHTTPSQQTPAPPPPAGGPANRVSE
jgi:hypothetical protein